MEKNTYDKSKTDFVLQPENCSHIPHSDPVTLEIVCDRCGLVMSSSLEANLNEKMERQTAGSLGPYASMFQCGGLNTTLGNTYRDASGKKIAPAIRQRIERLKILDRRITRLSSQRRQLQALADLRRLADRLSIQRTVKDESVRIYLEARKRNMIRGTPVLVAEPAVLFAACRMLGVPRGLREITKESLVNSKDARISIANLLRAKKFYRRLMVELQLQPHRSIFIAYVSKIAENLKISGQTQGIAVQILRAAKEKRFAQDKSPSGLAAAALYVACKLNNEKRTQKKLAKEACTSDAVVRHLAKALRKKVCSEHLQQETR